MLDMHKFESTAQLDGTGLTVGIVVARYNWHVTGALLQQATDELLKLGVAYEAIHVITVPGSYELAFGAKTLLNWKSCNTAICFGCVMKGETRHDVVVADAAAQGIQRVALDTGIPVIFGVICAETPQQAEARIGRGRECARAAIEMALLTRTLSKTQ
jgi:6,7-dimethyl-8-ribityllumazine synthase